MSERDDPVPDPSMTIPFRRPVKGEDPAPAAPAPATREAAPRHGPTLDLPSLILGFSAGVLLTSAVCGLAFAAFTLLG